MNLNSSVYFQHIKEPLFLLSENKGSIIKGSKQGKKRIGRVFPHSKLPTFGIHCSKFEPHPFWNLNCQSWSCPSMLWKPPDLIQKEWVAYEEAPDWGAIENSAAKLDRYLYAVGRIKPENKSVHHITDLIYYAINLERKVSFPFWYSSADTESYLFSRTKLWKRYIIATTTDSSWSLSDRIDFR